MKIRWTTPAQIEYIDQIGYVLANNSQAAYRLEAEVARQVPLLIDNPYLGRIGRVAGTRELVITRTPYIVIYSVDEQNAEIAILTFHHTSQQWPRPQE